MKAWQLIEKPENWTQKSFARDSRGEGCAAKDARAVCFCAYGALEKAYPEFRGFFDAKTKLHKAIGFNSIVFWNDNDRRTHAEVLEMFKTLDI